MAKLETYTVAVCNPRHDIPRLLFRQSRRLFPTLYGLKDLAVWFYYALRPAGYKTIIWRTAFTNTKLTCREVWNPPLVGATRNGSGAKRGGSCLHCTWDCCQVQCILSRMAASLGISKGWPTPVRLFTWSLEWIQSAARHLVRFLSQQNCSTPASM